MSSGLDLATAAESVAERRSFFELKTSMTDVRRGTAGGETGEQHRRGSCNSSCNLSRNNSLGKGLNEVGTEFLGLRYLDATYGKDKNRGGGMMRTAQSTSSRTAVAEAASTTVTRNTNALEPPKQTFMGVPTSDGKPLIELRSEELRTLYMLMG